MTFQMLPLESGQKTKVYLLSEPQSTFLISLMKNTRIVVDFKKELVKQFYIMRTLLMENQSLRWQQTRVESKSNRRMETEEIKQLIEYAKANGSQSADKYYIHFSNLANKAVGIESNSRDSIETSVNQLNNLILIEHIIGEVIKEGIQKELYYKDIYKACKKQIEQFKVVAYLKQTA